MSNMIQIGDQMFFSSGLLFAGMARRKEYVSGRICR